jgi:hypothetical protein
MSDNQYTQYLKLLRNYARILLRHLQQSEYPFDERIRQDLTCLCEFMQIRPEDAIAIEASLVDRLEQFRAYRNVPISEECLFDLVMTLELPPPPPVISPASVLRRILAASAASIGTCLLLVGSLSIGSSLLRARALKSFIDPAPSNLVSDLLTANKVEGRWGRLASYEGQLAFLLAPYNIQPDWFDTLTRDWAKQTGIDWQALSEAQKIGIAHELLRRLITSLHPDTWSLLGPYTKTHLAEFTSKRQSLNLALPAIDQKADFALHELFPELEQASIEETAFVDLWYVLRESFIKDSLVERI